MNRRAIPFVTVGLIGFGVQLSVLAALTHWEHWPAAAATAVAVEAAVLTNFVWHERWTWRDRTEPANRLERLGRFHLSNGLASIAGNVLITLALASGGISPVIANIVAVGLMSVWNFVAADRWVFLSRAATVSSLIILISAPAFAGEPPAQTIAAWNRHIADLEASIHVTAAGAPLAEPEGRSFSIPGGTVHEWRGSVVVPGVTVGELVDALAHPESLPAQEDIAETKVLSRNGDALRVYFKLVRRFIVSVTYDTEHDVTYTRRSASLAISRSVATRIAESEGGDRGFLWRLNSYWQYRQVGNDVMVDVLSLSLSREIPMLVKPVAGPIIDRIGRESMLHTLTMVQSASTAVRRRKTSVS